VLGFTGFGGGLAVLTQVEHRLVRREGWTDAQGFAEATALGQSLPGAISTNTLGVIGWRLARLRGALALEGGFVLPSALMMVVFALLYSRARELSVVAGLFHLLNPAVAGLVGAMTLRMAGQLAPRPDRAAAGLGGLLRDPWSLLVAVGAAVSVGVFGVGVPEVVIVAGFLGLGRHLLPAAPGPLALLPAALPLAGFALVAGPALPSAGALGELQRLGALAGVFLRAGTLTFGGGYVIVPVLEAELVRGLHWLTPQAFVDAMTLGQITPGPVVITSTFPAFVLVALVSASLERFRGSPGVQAFLRGLQPAVVGLMAAATTTLARNSVHDALAGGVAVAAFLLLWRLRVNPLWVVLGAGALGIAQALVVHG
jgi:chromate transporter